jgi:hypothetical protein
VKHFWRKLKALPVIDAIDNNIDKFVKGNIQPIIEEFLVGLQEVEYNWLDLEFDVVNNITIRQYIISELLGANIQDGDVIDINS